MSPERRGPLLVAPALITLFVVNIFPLMWSYGLSFFEYKANRIAPPVFVGLKNYVDVLSLLAQLEIDFLAGDPPGHARVKKGDFSPGKRQSRS